MRRRDKLETDLDQNSIKLTRDKSLDASKSTRELRPRRE